MDNRKRHLQLVAHFVNGYAEGWYMAVKQSYRNELDIKYTERKKNKQSFWEWTQGPYFSFAEGHLFYDTPKAYKKWAEAIKAIKTACQIISATPTILDRNKNLVEGMVKFTVYKPDEKFTSLKAVKDYKLSQTEFVNFLKTGVLDK
ncbi:MAG TPA: hypothetical protein VFG06_11550 [Thermodesulfovibrionales bacterium]|nr:hypothetical protein [Thermodesulfovibrionales bacterium]